MAELDSQDVRDLVELGFMAISLGMNNEAEAIFAGVRAARPSQEAGVIGEALVSLARGEVDAAVKLLRTLPPTDAARTFQAMTLKRSGDIAGTKEILGELVRTASDRSCVTLARELLDDIEKGQTPILR